LQFGAQGVDLLFEPGVLDRATDEGRGRIPIVAGERTQAFEPLVPDPSEEITLCDCSVARFVEPRAELGDRGGRWRCGRARVGERGPAVGIGGLAADAALGQSLAKQPAREGGPVRWSFEHDDELSLGTNGQEPDRVGIVVIARLALAAIVIVALL